MSSGSTIATPAARSDFPTWLPPMLVKELRQGLRTRGFVGAVMIFQFLMALLMMGAVVGADAMAPGVRGTTLTMINGFFWTLLTVQLLIITPARALGSLQSEIDARSLDLLLLTRLSAWRIVVGKWASLVAQAALLLVAMLPYCVVRYFAGSVDLVSDAATCLALFGSCAVMTAAALWTSGMPKIVRVIFIVVVVFSAQVWGPLMAGVGGGGPFAAMRRLGVTMWYYDGALALGFFLVAAVRRISPPAENHALLARLLPLLALAPVPCWAFAGQTAVAAGQFGFAGCFALLVCAVELGNVQRPMAVHVRPWLTRGWLWQCLGRFALPGWPSALLFTVVAIAVPAVVVQMPGLMPAHDAMRIAWLAVLALGGLAFPVLALRLFKKTAARSASSLFGLVLGAMSVLAATAAAMVSAFPQRYAGLDDFVRVLPVAGFWLSLGPDDLSVTTVVAQGCLVVAVLAAVWWLARDYWRHVAALEARVRVSTP